VGRALGYVPRVAPISIEITKSRYDYRLL